MTRLGIDFGLVQDRVRDAGYRLAYTGLRMTGRERAAATIMGRRIEWTIGSAGVLKALRIFEHGNPMAANFLDRIGPDDVFADIGANAGFFSILAARSATPPRSIVAVEPAPSALNLLLANVHANGVGDRVQVVAAAAGESDGVAELEVGSTDPSVETNRMADVGALESAPRGAMWQATPSKLAVSVRSIDSLVDSGVIPQPTVAKVDVEGFEGSVFRGMPATLRNVHTLFLELHHTLLPPSEPEDRVLELVRTAGLTEVASGRRGNQSHLVFARLG